MKRMAFYAENQVRTSSPEADYGVWWTDGKRFPHYRVSYIKHTGEVYAINQSTDDIEVLGVVPADALPRYCRTLDRILDGWAEPDISKHELAWVRAQLAFAGVTA